MRKIVPGRHSHLDGTAALNDDRTMSDRLDRRMFGTSSYRLGFSWTTEMFSIILLGIYIKQCVIICAKSLYIWQLKELQIRFGIIVNVGFICRSLKEHNILV